MMVKLLNAKRKDAQISKIIGIYENPELLNAKP
jgi:hypothetical protein